MTENECIQTTVENSFTLLGKHWVHLGPSGSFFAKTDRPKIRSWFKPLRLAQMPLVCGVGSKTKLLKSLQRSRGQSPSGQGILQLRANHTNTHIHIHTPPHIQTQTHTRTHTQYREKTCPELSNTWKQTASGWAFPLCSLSNHLFFTF